MPGKDGKDGNDNTVKSLDEQFSFLEDAETKKKVVELTTSIVTETIDKEITGLKSKNSELLDEKKKLQMKHEEFASKFKDIKPEDALEAYALVNSEEGTIFRQGKKLEELVEIQTSGMKKDHQAKMDEAAKRIKEHEDKALKWERKFRDKVVEEIIGAAAIEAKVLPAAYEDVVMRGKNIFRMSEDGDVEARDMQGNLLKVGDLIATPKNWVEGLKDSHPHYWPGSSGGGFSGSGGGSGDSLDDQILRAAKNKDHAEYRRLMGLKEERKKKK